MESGNTEKMQSTVTQNVVTLAAHVSLHKINREKVPWAWLLVVFSKDVLVKGTAPAKKKPIWGFSNFTYVIVDVYFTTFKSVIVSLVGHVIFLKGLIATTFKSSDPLHL